MRIVLDTLVALMVLAILTGVVMLDRRDRSQDQIQEDVRESVRLFQRKVTLQAALNKVPLNDRGHPIKVEMTWFESDPPANDLLSPAHPWLDVAVREECNSEHPTRVIATDPSVAAFWYNPEMGIIRARVPRSVSDTAALAMYNRINGTRIDSLFRSTD